MDGDGDVDAADISAIPGGGYVADLDADNDGSNADDTSGWLIPRVSGGLYATAVPDGWLSDPDLGSTVGTDNSIGYVGYMADFETGDYHVRNRRLDPATGRWFQRDTLGYADGMALHQYVASNPITYADWSGQSLLDPNKKKKAKRKCKEWADKERKRDQQWSTTLPDCPCELDVSKSSNPQLPCETDSSDWKSPEVRDQGITTWEPYHPNAEYQLQSKKQGDGSGQQCTYDKEGKFITGGPSAGTPDRVTPDFYYGVVFAKDVGLVVLSVLSGGESGIWQPGDLLPNTVEEHRQEDVRPFVACRDAGMLDVYFKYRPPNQGKDDQGKPCPQNTVD